MSAPNPDQCVYRFGSESNEGYGVGAELLGQKGAILAELAEIGLPIPPGLTIVTAVCNQYHRGGQLPAGLIDGIRGRFVTVEEQLGKKFGDSRNPLLFSIRCGAAVGMPGLMSTLLNLGLNDQSVLGLADSTGDDRFAYDSYRRLISAFGTEVMRVEYGLFEDAFDCVKTECNATFDTDVPVEGLRRLCELYKQVCEDHALEAFPQDPLRQLTLAIEAAFDSWNAPRAIRYRQIEQLSDVLGLAVTIQSMVFGNMGEDSATGIALTRNPSTGANELCGEFLVNAQGEDVVAGIRTPLPLTEMKDWQSDAFATLVTIKRQLEESYKHVHEFEFTIERGIVYLLHARSIRRRLTPTAAVRIAVEMAEEGLVDREEAIFRVDEEKVKEALRPDFNPQERRDVLCCGLPASEGVAAGRIALESDEAAARTDRGEKVIFVRRDFSPEDLDGMHAAEGLVAVFGGMTSHAAVVARGWGKPAVVNARGIQIDLATRSMCIGDRTLGSDDWISIDGNTGEIFAGRISVIVPTPEGALKSFLDWEEVYRPRGRPTPAYRGSEPYGFVSYAHRDRETVYPELVRLTHRGFRLWYDEGIQPSQSWTAEIAERLDNCATVLAFLSRSAVSSTNVQRELFHAVEQNKRIIPVQLEECELPPKLRFVMSDIQMLVKHRMGEDDYQRQLDEHLQAVGTARD